MPLAADSRVKNLKRGPGRRWGSKSRIPQSLKQAILDAAISHGADSRGLGGLQGYGFFLASKHPKAFCGLLGKLLPLQLDADLTNSLVTAVTIVSVPADQYLSGEALSPRLEIDQEPEPITPQACS